MPIAPMTQDRLLAWQEKPEAHESLPVDAWGWQAARMSLINLPTFCWTKRVAFVSARGGVLLRPGPLHGCVHTDGGKPR